MTTLLTVQSYNNNDTKDSGKEWEQLRFFNRDISNLILTRNNVKLERALILGAGNGNDVDISYFEESFNEVTIVDIDEEALNRFVSKANNQDKFVKVVMDLSGVGNELESINFSLPPSLIAEKLNKINPHIQMTKLHGTYDFVYSSNFTTQLVSPYITTMLSVFDKKQTTEVTTAINGLTQKILESIFKDIYTILDSNGIFIHSTDAFEAYEHKITGAVTPTVPIINKILTERGLQDFAQSILSELPNLAPYALSGSQLPKNVDLYTVESIRYVPWEFFSNDIEYRLYICAVYAFKKAK